MSVATILLIGIGILCAFYIVVLTKDYMAQSKAGKLEPETSFVTSGIIGIVVNFFDTLGIGSFAPATALFRAFKQVDDRLIPGTLNVSCTLPVCYQAYLFMSEVAVEPFTLASMLIAAAVGAYFGAGIVSKLPTKIVQKVMGIALAATGIIVILQLTGLFPSGGDAIGLTGAKLVIGVVLNGVLGALMTAGIGLYAPCMALVYMLGMSPLVAFPIMMGSCAYLMPVASVRFIKEGGFNRKASLSVAIGGLIGVVIAFYLVKSLPLTALKWLVVGVMFYTSFSLFSASKKAAA